MAVGTLSPNLFYAWDVTTGLPLAGGLVYTYAAGTSTPLATYTDQALLVPNTNPVVLNSAGYAVIYLVPGSAYKYVVKNSAGAVEYTQDNIAAVPTASPAVDVPAVFGESVAAGQAVYLSDGSGSKTAGQWWLTSATNVYSSTTPLVGFALAAFGAGVTGAVRMQGAVPGLSSLTIGARYYLSATAGAITSTAPVNARLIGQADSATSILAAPDPPPLGTVPVLNDFRLTLTSGVPVTTTDVTGATTLFFTPYTGNRFTVFDSSGGATVLTSPQISLAVPATTVQLYDVFVFNNAGVATLELLAWTNDTTRATAIVRSGGADAAGCWTKSGDTTRRYVGSMRTTGVSGQTEDSFAKRFLWNRDHSGPRAMRNPTETANTWTYTTKTWRQANANAANKVEYIVGVAEVAVELTVHAIGVGDSGISESWFVGIGLDSTSALGAGCVPGYGSAASSSYAFTVVSRCLTYPAVGYHYAAWLEAATATGGVTWYGDNNDPTFVQTGIMGVLRDA